LKNKKDYITKRYVTGSASTQIRYINGYNILKGKRISMPFASFFPDPGKLHKKHY